jgi:hypothetical protein
VEQSKEHDPDCGVQCCDTMWPYNRVAILQMNTSPPSSGSNLKYNKQRISRNDGMHIQENTVSQS